MEISAGFYTRSRFPPNNKSLVPGLDFFPIAKGVTAPGAAVGTGFAQCGGKTSFGRTTNIRRAAFETNEQSNGIMEEAMYSFDNANQKGWEALREHHYNVLHKKK